MCAGLWRFERLRTPKAAVRVCFRLTETPSTASLARSSTTLKKTTLVPKTGQLNRTIITSVSLSSTTGTWSLSMGPSCCQLRKRTVDISCSKPTSLKPVAFRQSPRTKRSTRATFPPLTRSSCCTGSRRPTRTRSMAEAQQEETLT